MQTTAKKTLSYLTIVLLSFLMAVSYQIFVFPNRFAPAGLNGICTMIQHLFGFKLGYLNLLINIPLTIVAYFLVSKAHALRSMVYTLGFSFFVLILDYVDLSALAYSTENGTSLILGPLVAGLFTGFCGSVMFRINAGFGGTELIASIIHRFRPHVNFFWVIFILNVSVAVASYFVYGYNMEPVLLCIMYCFGSSFLRDKITQDSRSAVRFEVVTDDPEGVSQAIINKLHHTATLVPGKGMYLNQDVDLLLCIINRSQVQQFLLILKEFPGTFAVASHVDQVVGNFRHIDRHGKRQVHLLDSGKR